MARPEEISNLLRQHAGRALCDDCIKERLGLPRRQQAQQVTSALGGTSDFRREERGCDDCGAVKHVTWAVPSS